MPETLEVSESVNTADIAILFKFISRVLNLRLRWFQLGWIHNFGLLDLGKIHYLWISLLGATSDLLEGYPLTLLTMYSIVPLNHVLFGEIQCLHDDAWFYDLDWFVSLQWVLVYCGSYICNDISCLVGFFLCISHLLDLPILSLPTLQSISSDPVTNTQSDGELQLKSWR
jgi:hypothetical protein